MVAILVGFVEGSYVTYLFAFCRFQSSTSSFDCSGSSFDSSFHMDDEEESSSLMKQQQHKLVLAGTSGGRTTINERSGKGKQLRDPQNNNHQQPEHFVKRIPLSQQNRFGKEFYQRIKREQERGVQKLRDPNLSIHPLM